MPQFLPQYLHSLSFCFCFCVVLVTPEGFITMVANEGLEKAN